MRKTLVFLCATSLFLGIVGSAEALPINGGFETGDLTGWNYYGDVSVATSFAFGGTTYIPTEGNYLAKLGSTADSSLWFDSILSMDSFDVIMPPSSTFHFWVRVIIPSQPEQEFMSTVTNVGGLGATVDLSGLTFGIPNDWHAFAYKVSVDQGETIFVDNVSGHVIPEPSTLLLLGGGLLGLVGLARRQKS